MSVDDVKDDNERKSERIQWGDVPTLLLNWIFEKLGITAVAIIYGIEKISEFGKSLFEAASTGQKQEIVDIFLLKNQKFNWIFALLIGLSILGLILIRRNTRKQIDSLKEQLEISAREIKRLSDEKTNLQRGGLGDDLSTSQ